MTEKPIFKNILQVGLVVQDLKAAMKRYWEGFGIGPWAIFTMDEESIPDLEIRGEKKSCKFRLALTSVGNVQLELIQPLDDKSIYAEFLKEKGEGLHHLACDISNGFDETVDFCKTRGAGVLQGGTTSNGLGFAYLDTQKELSCITEIYKFPETIGEAEPEAIYPEPGSGEAG